MRFLFSAGLLATVVFSGVDAAGEKTAAARGRDVLFHTALNPPFWTENAWQNVWKQWGLTEKPGNYMEALMERYGLHAAPYDNGGLPLGFVPSKTLFTKGITQTCLLCHASSVFGQTIIGMGNTMMDEQALFDELFAADGLNRTMPFTTSHVRGTIDPIAPVAFLMQFRDADLNVQKPIKIPYRNEASSKPPAWWQLKKKRTRDWTGGIDARSDRVDMAFLLGPLNSGAYIKKQEANFFDIRNFVLSVEAPKYPLPIDEKRAQQGKELFVENCAKCHGTYGKNWTYPNKIVDQDKIGTDRTLVDASSAEAFEYFNKTWLAKEVGPDGTVYSVVMNDGYQAPPLDGVWATAPYLHNCSVPTLYHVLNSKVRPKVFTRSYRTAKEDFDPVNVGWKFTELKQPADPSLSPFERRKIYDTSKVGLSNSGHTFGDKLSDDERFALIEYLKTL